MAVLLRHDRLVCAWCVRVRAEELMVRDYPVSTFGMLQAERFHGRRVLDLVTRRVFVDPDDDREMLWGEPA